MHHDRPAVPVLSDLCRSGAALLAGFAVLLAASAARAVAAPPPPAPGTWAMTGSLQVQQPGERAATRLADGRVLLAGGRAGFFFGGATSATDLYDPATGTWSSGGCLGDERLAPNVIALADGRVLIFGGSCGSGLTRTAEIFDPATGRFVPTGAMTVEHLAPAIALLHDGRVLVGGDSDAATEIYDPAATDPATGLKGSWTPSGFLHLPLIRGSTMTTLQDGRVLLVGGDSGGPFTVDNAELWDPTTGLWTPTGRLNTSRDDAVATLLGDGRVLLAGGFHEDVGFFNQTALSSSEIYDPASGTWTTTPGSMTVARLQAGGTLLPSGKVLVVGGQDTSRADQLSADVFDPATGTWTPTATAPTQAHSNAGVTRLLDGRILAAGGTDPTAAEIYAPVTDSWHVAAPPTFGRPGHAAALLPDGKVLVRGGCCDSDASAAELYDPAADRWTSFGQTATGRASASATLLGDGRVLIAGGRGRSGAALSSAELYDPATGSSTQAGAMATARSGQTATLLDSGKVLVAGGLGSDGAPLGSAELYDPATATWSPAGSLGARSLHTASLLPGGGVLVAGGRDAAGNAMASVERYDPAANAWSAAAHLGSARYGHTATTLADGRVLVVGGRGATGDPLASSEIFGVAGSWTAAAAVGAARVGHSATLLPGGAVLVAGGTGADGGALRSARLYDPGSDSWAATDPLSRGRSDHTATLLADGRVLAVGGIADASAEVYDPASPPKGSFLFTGERTFAGASTETLLRNGKVLVTGGDPPQGAELFNPLSGRWSVATSMRGPHQGHVAVLLADGRVLVAGGGTAAAEIFDPRMNRWTTTGAMLEPRTEFAGALLGDGRVLVVGGTDYGSTSAETYDPVTGAWTAAPPSASPRGHQSTLTSLVAPGCATHCGTALLAGGAGSTFNQLLELYDPASDSFVSPGRLGSLRTAPTATRLLDGRVLVASAGSAEVYDPAAPDTTATRPLFVAREDSAAALVGDGTVLAVGGHVPTEAAPNATAELYDPATNRWRLTGNLRTPRRGLLATGLARGPFSVCGENCGKVLVVGGVDDTGAALTSAELFTPQPRVTGVSVVEGPVSGGTLVTITGTGLAAAASVTFGDTQAASFIPDEKAPVTTLTVIAPPHAAGGVDIRVASAGGTSQTSAADRFTYVVVPPAAGAPASPAATARAPRDTTAPTLSALRLSHTRFRRTAPAARRAGATVPVGTTISFKLSEPATVALSFARVLPCRKPRHGCARLLKVFPALRIHGRAGSNRVAFRGRLNARRGLRPGRYRLTATATDAAGNRSRARQARFVLLG